MKYAYYVLCCMLSSSVVSDFATLWTVDLQKSVHGILQARILERVVMPSSRVSS